MKNDFYSYLDGFNRLTIIYPHKLIAQTDKFFWIITEFQKIELTINETYYLDDAIKYVCSINESISLNKDYIIIDNNNYRSILKSGQIVRTDLFEMLYYYDKYDLGATYYKDKTIFKVWSPVAHELELELIDTNGVKTFYDFTAINRGVWVLEIKGDLERYKYRLNVRTNGYFHTTLDPYAISGDANGEYNYIIDLAKVYQFKTQKPHFSGKAVDAIIYEIHIRDFTIDKLLNNKYPGKFLGLCEKNNTPEGNPTGLEYLANLGITHLQIMPIFDFGGVDETEPDKFYNWGYNPEQYNVPEGWYSTDPSDPYKRINELRFLIDEIHRHGIRVVMDVVFNHVFNSKNFPFNALVPGYYFRYDVQGIATESSGCENDLASERKMVRHFILNSLKYWASFYQVSGFRFDLMGLLDTETINEAQMLIKDIDPEALLYGEGWMMESVLPLSERATIDNHKLLPDIAFFNDKFRDNIRGNYWAKTRGFALGGNKNIHDFIYSFTGSCIDNYMFLSPNQSINYIECHDNHTFYDYAIQILDESEHKNIKDYQALALSLTILSQGVPFIHAGSEVFRSKEGIENSYKSSDIINMIYWKDIDYYWEYVIMLKDLIEIRKEFSEFRYEKKSLIKQNIIYSGSKRNFLLFEIKGIENTFEIYIKNDYELELITFQDKRTLIFDGRKRIKKEIENIELRIPGVYLLSRG